ncbi:MAG: ankyrin repeat domain-containing protein [Chromatiaceae bacterium]|jgi:ankyrin repeat protein
MKRLPLNRHFGLATRTALAAFLIIIAGCLYASDIDNLYRAAGDGNTARVQALLDTGVDVNARTSDQSYALNRAAVFNQVEMVRLLLERGADPNVQNSEGDTPLICATKYAGGEKATVQLLVDGGTDLTIRDKDGKTALDYAKAADQLDAVELLGGFDS